MTENPLRSELSSLERKLILLINDHQKLKREMELLKSENEGFKDQLRSREAEISDFHNKDKMSKIVNGTVVGQEGMAQEDTAELVDVLNGYIREVDKCIAQLSE